MSYDAVLLLGFGGPEHVDEVVPFLQRVTAGRGIPPERLIEVGRHYLTLGGVSPINAQNRALRDALAERLAARGVDVDLVLANRNSAPFVEDVVADLAAQGRRRLLALATAAYSSYSGCRQYREDLGRALGGLADAEVTAVKIPPFPRLPGLIEADTDLLAAALAQVDAAERPGVRVMFTTHSIPLSMASSAGPEGARTDGDLYSAQHRHVARSVIGEAARRAGYAEAPPWELVYQSRSGAPHIPWLEPDINDAIVAAAGEGVSTVVIVPIGFLTDHVEVIWDLDTQARQTAEGVGVRTIRVPTVGTHPAFLDSLADLVAAHLRNPGRPAAAGEFCFGTCCRNPRHDLPAAAGVHSVVE